MNERHTLRSLAARFDEWVQKTPGPVVIWALIVVVAAVGGPVVIWVKVIGWWGLLIGVLVALAILNYRCVRISANYGREVASLRQLLSSIWRLVPQRYKFENVELTFRIDKNGDGVCIREYTVVDCGEEVYWKHTIVGATEDADAEEKWEDVGFVARDVSKARMPCEMLINQPRNKIILVLFLPPIRLGEPRTFTEEFKWRGLWKSLIENDSDSGRFDARVGEGTKSITMNIIAPPQFQWTRFAVQPHLPTSSYEIKEKMGLSVLVWQAQDLDRVEYTWFVGGQKKP